VTQGTDRQTELESGVTQGTAGAGPAIVLCCPRSSKSERAAGCQDAFISEMRILLMAAK
jgi:hypothetical protein